MDAFIETGLVPCGREKLLTDLNTYTSIHCAHNTVSKRNFDLERISCRRVRTLITNLLCDVLNDSREEMILPLSVLHPGSKVPHFTVISIIREPHLRANE